jgi:hypothetical protein
VAFYFMSMLLEVICQEGYWNYCLMGVTPVYEIAVCAEAFGRGLSTTDEINQ